MYHPSRLLESSAESTVIPDVATGPDFKMIPPESGSPAGPSGLGASAL
jgi:hypothetical protein